MKRNWRGALVYLIVFFILSCLPVVPVQTAPVIPNPVYRLTFLSFLGLFWRRGLVGVSYRWGWYTGAAIFALIAVGIIVGAYLSARLARSSSRDKPKTGGGDGAAK
jgi:hypothetical protein